MTFALLAGLAGLVIGVSIAVVLVAAYMGDTWGDTWGTHGGHMKLSTFFILCFIAAVVGMFYRGMK